MPPPPTAAASGARCGSSYVHHLDKQATSWVAQPRSRARDLGVVSQEVSAAPLEARPGKAGRAFKEGGSGERMFVLVRTNIREAMPTDVRRSYLLRKWCQVRGPARRVGLAVSSLLEASQRLPPGRTARDTARCACRASRGCRIRGVLHPGPVGLRTKNARGEMLHASVDLFLVVLARQEINPRVQHFGRAATFSRPRKASLFVDFGRFRPESDALVELDGVYEPLSVTASAASRFAKVDRIKGLFVRFRPEWPKTPVLTLLGVLFAMCDGVRRCGNAGMP